VTLQQFIAAIVSVIKNDALKAGLPALASFFTAVAADPSHANILAQIAKLEIDLIATVPSIEQDVFKQIAALIETEAQALTAKA